jgi:hypothetical protein
MGFESLPRVEGVTGADGRTIVNNARLWNPRSVCCGGGVGGGHVRFAVGCGVKAVYLNEML